MINLPHEDTSNSSASSDQPLENGMVAKAIRWKCIKYGRGANRLLFWRGVEQLDASCRYCRRKIPNNFGMRLI